jgi:hypothetical protein
MWRRRVRGRVMPSGLGGGRLRSASVRSPARLPGGEPRRERGRTRDTSTSSQAGT